MRIRSLIVPAIAAVVVGIVALALGHSRGTAGRTPSAAVESGKSSRLRIANYAFAPSVLTVKVGTKVTVTNADSTAHTATARSGAFDTGTLKPGRSGSFMVTKPGN